MIRKKLVPISAIIFCIGIFNFLFSDLYSQYINRDLNLSLDTSRSGSKNDQSIFLQAPNFSAGIRIKANGIDMKVDTYASAPCVVDWNGDGKKDLLVGCFYNGNVYLYLNSGTNSNPVFTTGSKLQADGVDISVSYG